MLAQVNNLDDKEFNTLPPQPPPRKKGTSPGKQKEKPKEPEGQPSAPTPSTSSTPGSQESQKSDKAQHIEAITPDHTPEEPNVWCDIMKLHGTRRNNQIADGYCQWLNKNYDSGIHEVP